MDDRAAAQMRSDTNQMEPLSITVGCVNLRQAIDTTTADIVTYLRRYREARGDLIKVTRELSDLRLIIELLHGEDASEADSALPDTLQAHLRPIFTGCTAVMSRISAVLDSCQGASNATHWPAQGRMQIAELRISLEAHKSSLDLALEMAALIATKHAREERSGGQMEDVTRGEPVDVLQDTAEILLDIERLRAQLPVRSFRQDPQVETLNRWLDGLSTYAETIRDEPDDEAPNCDFSSPMETSQQSSPSLATIRVAPQDADAEASESLEVPLHHHDNWAFPPTNLHLDEPMTQFEDVKARSSVSTESRTLTFRKSAELKCAASIVSIDCDPIRNYIATLSSDCKVRIWSGSYTLHSYFPFGYSANSSRPETLWAVRCCDSYADVILVYIPGLGMKVLETFSGSSLGSQSTVFSGVPAWAPSRDSVLFGNVGEGTVSLWNWRIGSKVQLFKTVDKFRLRIWKSFPVSERVCIITEYHDSLRPPFTQVHFESLIGGESEPKPVMRLSVQDVRRKSLCISQDEKYLTFLVGKEPMLAAHRYDLNTGACVMTTQLSPNAIQQRLSSSGLIFLKRNDTENLEVVDMDGSCAVKEFSYRPNLVSVDRAMNTIPLLITVERGSTCEIWQGTFS